MRQSAETNKDSRNETSIIILAALIPAVLAAVIYLPSLKNGFVNWDDGGYVYENLRIRSINSDFIKYIFTTSILSNWYPLTMFSFALDYAIWGLDPFGYHLVNVVFHALNTFLVFIVAERLFAFAKKDSPRASLAGALITSLLFGLHPLHVESVAWISERKDVLSGFFFLLSVLAYMKYASREKGGIYFAAALISFALALMSKPMAISLPLVLIILDLYPLGRFSKKTLLEKIPFFILSILSALVTIWAQEKGSPVGEVYPLVERVFVAVRAYMFYLYKTFLPLGLAPYYPRPDTIDFLSLGYSGSLIALVAITAFCLVSFKRQRMYLALWLYYLITLVPVIGIMHVGGGGQAAADRYTYLPGLAPFFLVGATVAYLYGRPGSRVAVGVMMALLTVPAAYITYKQIPVWKDSITLWSYEIEKYPSLHIAYNNRGLAYEAAGKENEAMEDFTAAIRVAPKFPEPYVNRGALFQRLGYCPEAVGDYTMAITLNPGALEPYYNRGLCHQRMGDMVEAVNDYGRAIAVKPDFVEAYIHRGIIYRDAKDFTRAIVDFNRAVLLGPSNILAYMNRGVAYFMAGDYEKASADFSAAVSINGRAASAFYYLGLSYSMLGDDVRALQNIKRASDLGLKEAQDYLKERGL